MDAIHTIAPTVKTNSKAMRCFLAICSFRTSGTGMAKMSRSRVVLMMEVTNMKSGTSMHESRLRSPGGMKEIEMGMQANMLPKKSVNPKMATTERSTWHRSLNRLEDQIRRYDVTMDILTNEDERPQRGGELHIV